MAPETSAAGTQTKPSLTGGEGLHLHESKLTLTQQILENLHALQGKSIEIATTNDWYMAVAYTVRHRMMAHYIEMLKVLLEKKVKVVGYLSAEFLMGPHLGNALINLGMYEETLEATRKLGLDLKDLLDIEEEPGLGNGGLGRLAACFMDSMTTLGIHAIGYGIRYEFGLFEQQIRDGWQYEVTDKWLRLGNPWEIARPEMNYKVKFGGRTEYYTSDEGYQRVRWIPEWEVKGVAHDTPVPGYHNDALNLLRLWKSEAVESFDFEAFNRGDYHMAVEAKVDSENIGKILYPNDESDKGKRLRLSQQYFFVSCSLQDVLRMSKIKGISLDELPEFEALQLNDTHPAIAVAELMRLLVDEEGVDWERAWNITTHTFAYTNHTLLPEALEKWPMPLFSSLLPRLLEIIFEINARFLDGVKLAYPADERLISSVSIIDEAGEKSIRMAHLACIGSHKVNGVSALHGELLKKELFRDFYQLEPRKFISITNGVTPRRWIKLYNPALAGLISTKIGEGWITRMSEDMPGLEKWANDPAFHKEWQEVKRIDKHALIREISKFSSYPLDPSSLFDIMVKRIHEYKRQHLNVLHIIHLYNRICNDPATDIVPRTFVFGGKAAPGYYKAKLIIKLIHSVGEVVNKDPRCRDRLRVIFYPDFSVKHSECVYRAADLSEQLSTAGKEASGTGNMKFAMNGALTIGTLDGANVEIREAVGPDNFFLFGATVEEIRDMQRHGYRPYDVYQGDQALREVIDRLMAGDFSKGDKMLFKPLTDSLLGHDPFFVLHDFRSYVDCQEKVNQAYKDQSSWTRMAILNLARMGGFSSDRSIRDYAEQVWKLKPAEWHTK